MKHNGAVFSERYYLFRHVPKSEEDTVMYRDSTGTWYADFDKAHLWADHDFLVKKAKSIAKTENQNGQRHNYCIGKVTIEVNSFFVIEVIAE